MYVKESSMESRVDKYGNKEMSRTAKNHHLYEEISDADITSFDVNSNTTVLGNNSDVIDVSKLRDMLDKKYREEPKKSKIAKFNDSEDNSNISLEETGEYDINTIMNKAKENKEEDYEIERLKKLRNTQVDILNDLDIDSVSNEKTKAVSDEEGEKLRSLIDTINLTEETNAIKNMDPLDLLSDLKGDDDETKVMGVNNLEKELEDSKESSIQEGKTLQQALQG